MEKLSRRHFLKSSATVAGGMMISFHIPAQDPSQETMIGPVAPMTTSELNAWLTIDPDNTITIRVAQSEMGQGVLTALPMIIADELEADWRDVRAEHADVNRSIRQAGVYKRMLTGGSGAVRISRPYLQQAGAEAREKLIKAAAETWGVSRQECHADYGKVHHKATRRSVTYGEVAGLAAQLSVANVKIKSPEDFSLIGLPKPRLDTPEKVDGSAIFGMDVRLDNMAYAAVQHCPVLGGRVRSFRFNAIRNMPGVILAVRFDNGIAVVAETWWQANKAAKALPIQWTIGDEGKTHSETFRNEYLAALGTQGTSVLKQGETLPALEVSEKIIESDYLVPYLAHASMEPLNCTAHRTDEGLSLWLGTQDPESALNAASKLAGVAPEKVQLTNCLLGGGFGRRAHTDIVEEAVQIAMEIDRPVQLIWSREEDMRSGRYRPMAAMRFKAGFDLEKQVVAYTNHSVTHSILRDLGAPVDNGIDPTSVEGLSNMPYEFSPKSITHTIKNTHLSSYWWRSVGSSQNAFAMECFIDEMAEAATTDPILFRKQYLVNRPDLLEVLEELRQKSDWNKRLPPGTARGVALHECFGTIAAQVAEVSVNNGKADVHRIVSVVNCGNLVNPAIAEAQIESGIIYGLSAALYGKITIEKGRVLEDNFDTYHVIQQSEVPIMETHWLLSGGDKWGGLGEPGLPCVAPAIVNALHKITKRRIRSLPISDYYSQRA